MFSMSDFFRYAEENDVDLFEYSGLPAAGVTVRDGCDYAIALDLGKIKDSVTMRSVCMHEQGHCMTGALHKVYSPYELVAKNEHKARRASIERYLPYSEIRQAMYAGCTELWQLAEWFGLPQKDIEQALEYYIQCRGYAFNT